MTNKKRYIFTLLLVALCCIAIQAQQNDSICAQQTATEVVAPVQAKKNQRKRKQLPQPVYEPVIKRASSLRPLSIGELITEGDSLLIAQEAAKNAELNPIFIDWTAGAQHAGALNIDSSNDNIIAQRERTYKYFYVNEPEIFPFTLEQLPNFAEVKTSKLSRQDVRINVVSTDVASQISQKKLEEKLWAFRAQVLVHMSQNYISSNWYNGGESNLAGHLYGMAQANYNNKKWLQWDNKIEWRLGVNSTMGDSLRFVRVNEDLLKINSKLGVKAVTFFYYTAEVDFQTHFFNTFKTNTYVRTTGPFSPIRMNVSLGIDYKYKSELSVFLSPVSYKLTYVADTTFHSSLSYTDNIPHQLSMPEGLRMINQLGALLRLNWQRRFNDSISAEAKFYFFGSYLGPNKGVEIDAEVIGNFRINRFFSAKVSLNPRFDTITRPADGSKPKLQFKELISLGFNYQL